MIQQSWKSVLYFEPSEFDDPDVPGSGIHIDACLVMLLDKLRMTIGAPFVVHSKIGGAVDMNGIHGHSANSYHTYAKGCKAVDGHINTLMNYREQYNVICQCGFGGVGVYVYNPDAIWWHLDTRPRYLTQHWACRVKGKYDYLL